MIKAASNKILFMLFNFNDLHKCRYVSSFVRLFMETWILFCCKDEILFLKMQEAVSKWNTQFTHKYKKLIRNKENNKKIFSLYPTENK